MEGYSKLRSEKAKKYDFWPTPEITKTDLFSLIKDFSGTWVENSVGQGALLSALIDKGVKQNKITAIDIDKDNIDHCKELWPHVNYIHGDFLDSTGKWDNCVYNPPFTKWEEFTRKSLECCENLYAILPNNWAHSPRARYFDLQSRIVNEVYDRKYFCEFGIQQCISLFVIKKDHYVDHSIAKEKYFHEKDLLAKVENGQTTDAFKQKLVDQRFGIIVPWGPTFNNSGCLPRGTKVNLGPVVRAIHLSNEFYVDENFVMYNGKLKSGKDFEFLYIRRHTNDRVQKGSRRDAVWCLYCENEKELDKLIDFYINYPVDFHCKFSNWNCSKHTIVPDWYAKKYESLEK
jgi:predicted RNA methylase